MSTSFNFNALSALDSFNETFSKLDASTGAAVRPVAGTWPCIITSIDIESGDDVNIVYDRQRDLKIPATMIRFNYKITNITGSIPPNMKNGDSWPGRPIMIPNRAIPDDCSKGKRQNIEIGAQRLKGHLKTLLGREVTNLGQALREAHELLANPDRTIIGQVQCKIDKDDKNPEGPGYFEEFLPKLITS